MILEKPYKGNFRGRRHHETMRAHKIARRRHSSVRLEYTDYLPCMRTNIYEHLVLVANDDSRTQCAEFSIQ